MSLHDCITSNRQEGELFLVGSGRMVEMALEGRDRQFQAVLAVNESFDCGSDIEEMLDNHGCRSLIACLGVGIASFPFPEESFDLDQIRYNRIFLVTEDNGTRSEILRFLITWSSPVVRSGMVYVPQVPLPLDFSHEVFDRQILRPETRRFRMLEGGEC